MSLNSDELLRRIRESAPPPTPPEVREAQRDARTLAAEITRAAALDELHENDVAERERRARERERTEFRDAAKRSLFFFTKYVLGYTRLTEHLHEQLCGWVQNVANRKALVLVPRGFYKTTICTIAYPLWLLVNDPDQTILIATHTMTYSQKVLREIKGHFEKNPTFRKMFGGEGGIIPSDFKATKWAESEIVIPRNRTVKESSIEVIGVGGSSVGSHFRTIIEDDLVDEDNLISAEQMGKVIDWHKYAVSLLRDPSDDRRLVVGTRWAFFDLYSHVKSEEKTFSVYERKAVEDGQAIFPERFSLKVLAEIEQAQGPYIFGCQYLNEPTDPARQIFRPEWCPEVEWSEPLLANIRDWKKFVVFDPALSEKRDGSFSGYALVAVGPQNTTLVIEAFKRRWNVGQMIDRLFADAERFPGLTIGVEMASGWKTLKYPIEQEMLKRGKFFMLQVLTPNSKLSKEARIRALQPYFANLRFTFVKGACVDLLADVRAFPFGDGNYDALDALAYLPQMWTDTSVVPPRPASLETDPWNMAHIMKSLRTAGGSGMFEGPLVRHQLAMRMN